MDTGDKLRFKAHNILFNIHNHGLTYDSAFDKIVANKISTRDIAFLNNVCLNSMRYSVHSKKILLQHVKKKPKIHEEILLGCAITQIVFLNFKEYAVINSTVEIAKKLKLFHGFVNACLRKISINKKSLQNIKINIDDLPNWFKKETRNISDIQMQSFLDSYSNEPDLHLVFKNKDCMSDFGEKIIETSETSGFLVDKKKVENISSYKKGFWWVQDFSSSFPLNNVKEEIIDKSCFDMCAAPGGKSFQILSKKKNIVLNDKSKKRTEILKRNLQRLNFDPTITNDDVYNLELKEKYDFIIIDAPCSAIGTIRKNPEIFYRKKEPNFYNLVKIQKKMLDVASKLLRDNGTILYMVCSFLEDETSNQIKYFLNNNKNFYMDNFSLKNKHYINFNIIKNKQMLILPMQIDKCHIDGYFAVFLKKGCV